MLHEVETKRKTLGELHRGLVIALKRRCEENIKFNNRCCDEFYKLQMTPLKEPPETEESVRLLKIKIDLQHQIKIQRFVRQKQGMRGSPEFLRVKDSLSAQHLRVANQFNNLLRVHPGYREFWLERMEDSYLFDSLPPKENPPTSLEEDIDRVIREKEFIASRLGKQLKHSMELMTRTLESTTSMLRLEFHSKLRSRFFKFVQVSRLDVESFAWFDFRDSARRHCRHVADIKGAPEYRRLVQSSLFRVQNDSLWGESKGNPYFFQQVFHVKSSLPPIGGSLAENPLVRKYNLQADDFMQKAYITKLLRKRQAHLVILCHGYQGRRVDMRILENYFIKIIPHTVFLVSEFNQNHSGPSIQAMARNLAREVCVFVKSFPTHSKISFVGHSLGGLIIRAALPLLKHLRPFMCSYVSLAVPHLGCKKSKNFLINLGTLCI